MEFDRPANDDLQSKMNLLFVQAMRTVCSESAKRQCQGCFTKLDCLKRHLRTHITGVRDYCSLKVVIDQAEETALFNCQHELAQSFRMGYEGKP
ncbi:unnamed protein product [Cyprideis torosa]|uniref:Uncharacterized protein n=1 Tax=Cyprideis torosa TaxID=163714 RepID=A0A7R8W6T0_9CRUS|nr:unnamed protein product [Cyprideis torosa]CAG0886797.1 unnamed protein product [Cyprideis torosa]